jgi:ABC-type antimicrobial peptide transport system permease subunit
MLQSFFLLALRNIRKTPGFSAINILGLAIGLASAMIMLIWIENEISYDQFHEKRDRLFEAWNRFAFSGETQCWNTTPKVLGPTLVKDFPEVERMARMDWNQQRLLGVGETRIFANGSYVDPDFVHMFSFPFVSGNPHNALDNPSKMVITEALATKLFGKEDPMGKQVKVEGKHLLTVSAVVKNLPNNTRFKFEYLLNWKFMEAQNGGPENQWGNNSTRTFVLLKQGANLTNVQAKMKVLKPKYDKSEPKWEMFLYPAERWRLYSTFENGVETGGLMTYVRMFGMIAGFVLLIACINFMNLSTARSEKRAKEVGIRKVVGAMKSGLISQFIAESVLMAFLAGLLAIGLVQLALPGFNKLAEKILVIQWANPNYWLAFVLFVLFTGILAGSYPAFFLSRFEPVRVLKGTFQPVKSALQPRKVLVVFQFSVAIALIIGTIIVRKQIQHAQDRELGYNKNNLVYVYLEGDLGDKLDVLKNELLSKGIATGVTATSSPITECWSDGWGMNWTGKDPNDRTDIDRFTADDAIAKTFGMQFIHGRDFDLKKFPTDSSGMVINESSLKLMKFKNPIGQIVSDNGKDWHVIGVVKDFIMRSPYSPHKPLIIAGPKSGWFNTVHIKMDDARPVSQNLKDMELIFRKFNPEYPFEHKFVDQEYAQKFEDESKIGTMAGVFAALTIFISCMGLFALAAHTAENRTKEIGIRKVLGASVMGIVRLLSKDFILLIFIAILIATPLAWWTLHSWLEDYEYRIEISWGIFGGAGILALVIAMLTIGFQAIKAAVANPVKSLRTE